MIKSDDMTANKLIEQYLDLKTNLAVSTKENYTHIYEKNIKDTKLGKSKVKDIKKWIFKLFTPIYLLKEIFAEEQYNYIKIYYFPHFKWL